MTHSPQFWALQGGWDGHDPDSKTVCRDVVISGDSAVG